MIENQMYCIYLEDYAYPRSHSKLRAYIGTKTEIRVLMAHLSADAHTALRYGETIAAVDCHDINPDVIHHMAGQEMKVLEPVQVLFDRKFKMQDFSWIHNGHTNSKIPAKVSSLEVYQMLVQLGNQLIRCARLNFEDFAVCVPGIGWVLPQSRILGFPGMVQYIEPDKYQATLFAEMETYDSSEIIQAIKDANALKEKDYEVLCDDILGVL